VNGLGQQAARWAPIPLRLIVGYGFMAHGFAKLTRGPDAFAAVLHGLGMPAAGLLAWSTILVELFGGLAVLVGAFVALASLPLAAVLLVAIFTVHLPYGFSSIKLTAVTAAGAQFGKPGYECDLLYLACLAALVLGGSGPLTMEGLLRKFVRRKQARRSIELREIDTTTLGTNPNQHDSEREYGSGGYGHGARVADVPRKHRLKRSD
jgi:putative oxidoreductase